MPASLAFAEINATEAAGGGEEEFSAVVRLMERGNDEETRNHRAIRIVVGGSVTLVLVDSIQEQLAGGKSTDILP
jgi:hypothetical protein